MNAYLAQVDRSSDGLGQLGDIICVEGDCKLGESLVTQMKGFYTAVTAPGFPGATAMATKYGPSVSAILKAKSEKETWARRWLPFHPNCCAIRDIGKQAQDITRQMAADAKVVAPSMVPVPWTDEGGGISSAIASLWGLAKLGIIVVGGIYVWKQIDSIPTRKAKAA